MVIVMAIMMLGFFGYQGMHADIDHHSSVPSASQEEKIPLDLHKR